METKPAASALFFVPVIFAFAIAYNGCASWAASAEEYYSIGMAYFDRGKFEEAEKWLVRAKTADRTKTASEYNLGRIAFETGRFEEAARHFEGILKKDPDNVLALRAAAYTRIKTGSIDAAEKHYGRLLSLVPESADDGYNYALVLYAMEKYAEAEKVLGGYSFALLDNNDVLLLYARSQNAQGKVEAADSYAKWLAVNSDPKVRYEYAKILEGQELYARALEEYRSALSALPAESADPKKSDLRFTLARLLLIADSESADGLAEMKGAADDGFKDIAAIEELLKHEKISAESKEGLRSLINEMTRAGEEAAKAEEAAKETKAAEGAEGAGLEAQVEAGSDSPDK